MRTKHLWCGAAALALVGSAVVGVVGVTPAGASAGVDVCVGVGQQFFITSWGLPGSTETYTVGILPTGIMSLSATTSGPWGNTATVVMTYPSDGYGQVAFYGRGDAPGAATITAEGNNGGSATINVNVDKVASVSVADHNGTTLPANPAAGGGLQVVTDVATGLAAQATPVSEADFLDARTVKVSTTMERATPSMDVYFGVFDVDDPSSNSTLDTNGTQGNDNFGSAYRSAQFSSNDVLTQSDGTAQTDLHLTTQPGDNFKVVASCNPYIFSRLIPSGMDVQFNDGTPITANDGQVSDMLTVWRKLHIEVDKMPPVDGNQILGTIDRVGHSRGGTTKLVLSQTMTSTDPTPTPINLSSQTSPGQFENGRISITGKGDYTVLDSSRNAVIVAGVLDRSAQGLPFVLVDDDNASETSVLSGDEGQTLNPPDTSLLTAGSTDPTTNVLAQAYVIPAYDIGSGQIDKFWVNAPADTTTIYKYNWSAHDSDTNFWTAYLLGGYQPTLPDDGDPNSEGDPTLGGRIVGGITDNNRTGSTIFAETIHDVGDPYVGTCWYPGVVAHEVTHQFGALDLTPSLTAGLMSSNCASGDTFYAPESLRSIRSAQHP